MGENFHARIMNIPENAYYSVDSYSCGHKDARHAAAEIALEADRMIEKLALNESAFVDLEIRKDSAEQSLAQMDEYYKDILRAIKSADQEYQAQLNGNKIRPPNVDDTFWDAYLEGCLLNRFHHILAIYQGRESLAPVDNQEDIISEIAHQMTGAVASTCCHKSGGRGGKYAHENCSCREVARNIIELLEKPPTPKDE